jgi:TPP-dependent pyruvate/acetoin dehydrogenase alpha subunit
MMNDKDTDAFPLALTRCRDPIEWVKKQLVDHSLVSADHIKDIEKEIRKDVQDALKKVRLPSSISFLDSHNATWPASSLLLLFTKPEVVDAR